MDSRDIFTVGTTFVGGRRHWLYSDGRTLPVIAGGSGEGEGGGQGGQGQGGQGGSGDGSGQGGQGNGGSAGSGQGDGQGSGSGGGSGDGGQGGQGQGQGDDGKSAAAGDSKTHSQDEVDAIAQMERRRGFRKHVRGLGLSVEDAERILREHQSGDGKTGAQGSGAGGNGGQGGSGGSGSGDGNRGSGSTSSGSPAAPSGRWEALAERALFRAGFPADAPEAQVRRAVRMLDVDPEADDLAEFTTEAAKLKTEMPALFAAKGTGGGGGTGGQGDGGSGTGGTPSSTPGGTAPPPAPPAGAAERGKSRAAQFNARRGVKA